MRRRDTQRLADLLPQVLHDAELEQPLAELRVVRAWPKVVGQMAASYTADVAFRNGVLVVRLTSAALRHELMLSRPQLIAAINREAGTTIVKEVRLV